MHLTIQIIITITSIVGTIFLGIITLLTFLHDKKAKKADLEAATNQQNFYIKAKKAELEAAINQQCNIINNGIGMYGIGGPYTVPLEIPSKKYKKFGYYAVVFFHQLNLLNMVYKNGPSESNLLTQSEVDGYISWTKKVFKPWVNRIRHLKQLYTQVIAQEDIFGKNFIKWLKGLMD